MRPTRGGGGDMSSTPLPVDDLTTLGDSAARQVRADRRASSSAVRDSKGRTREAMGVVLFSLALSGLGVDVALVSGGFPGSAGLWPRASGIALGCLGLGAAFQAIIAPETGKSRRQTAAAATRELRVIGTVAFFACAVVYLICLQLVGFLPATLAFAAGAVGALMRGWRARVTSMVAICALVVGIDLLLSMVFQLQLP